MVQPTSIEAYKDIIPELGDRQRQVLDLFTGRFVLLTNNEIAARLGWSINRVTPRVFELRRKQELVMRDKRACTITGRTGLVWGLPSMRTDFFDGK